MNDLSDSQLINLCLDKNPLAWSEFIERFSKVIYWAIRDRLRRWGYQFQEGDVENIYQEIFVSLWQKPKLAEIKDKEKLSGWLVMVAGNNAVDYFRKKKRKEPKDITFIFKDLAFSNDNPLQLLHSRELKQTLESVLGTLPSKEKIVITLSYLYNKKHREIAEILNIPINTVSTLIFRTKERLKDKLEEKGIRNIEDI
ncbi:MAG: sigma-70 family RNA polymerase sigma factor [Candidatus Omnitrophota bacterium]|nr:sigma-70 family RNA polymerase sigma factor [Candidatus Omnitrophota bacterium]